MFVDEHEWPQEKKERPVTEAAPRPKTIRNKRPTGELTGAERRALRALGHHLNAVVQVGQRGVTPELVAATSEALAQHELIKVSINGESTPEARKDCAAELAIATQSQVAQVIGRVVLLYRPIPDAPKVTFTYVGDKVSAEWVRKPRPAQVPPHRAGGRPAGSGGRPVGKGGASGQGGGRPSGAGGGRPSGQGGGRPSGKGGAPSGRPSGKGGGGGRPAHKGGRGR